MCYKLKEMKNEEELYRTMEIWLNTNLETHWFINEDYWHSNFSCVKNILPKSKIIYLELNGVIIGFIFSPVKHGVNVRVCNNGNHDRGEG